MKFIAYFDYLGFGDFIERNDLAYQEEIINNNYRDIESALSQGKLKDGQRGKIADLSDSTINCTVFSDTMVFWTQDDTVESLSEMLAVAYRYNWTCIDYFFPVRGCVVHGELVAHKYVHKSNSGAVYGVNSVFGKGLVKAHAKAEAQDWAGSVVDESVISFLAERGINPNNYLTPFAKKYKVPYKHGIHVDSEEWVLNLLVGQTPLNDTAFENFRNNIVNNFGQHNKRTESASVQRKIANTIGFLESYR